jgi:hypothetical protein
MKVASSFIVAIITVVSLNSNALGQSKSRHQIIDEISSKQAEIAALEKELLAPSEDDRQQLAEFLRKPNTGLIRLMPRELFDGDVNKKNKTFLSIRGGGAFYSFSRLTHEYGQGSDILLESGYLSVGFAGADYGMLLNVGDIDLEVLSIDSPYVAALARYQAVATEPEARIEQRRVSTGTIVEGMTVKSRLPLEIKATYLVRSIGFYKSDVLVGFKVLRKDSDGSVIIAWKLLHNYATPKLAQNN